MITREWVALHRKHHAKCETEEDPHSPQVKGIKKVFFEGAELYRAGVKDQAMIEQYKHGTPEDWIENNVFSRFKWQGLGVMLVTNWFLFGFAGIAIWAVQMMWIPVTAAGIINGIGHYWGYRNQDCNDASSNIVPWGIIIGGEELHNNHHTYPTSAKLSTQWYEFDMGWMYIKIFSYLGLAKVKKIAPQAKFATTTTCDLESLKGVLAHRYDVMVRFQKALKTTWQAELQAISHQFDGEKINATKVWFMSRHKNALPENTLVQVNQVVETSPILTTFYDMKLELQAIWARSNKKHEDLLLDLQKWCERAEASGIIALQEFAMKLKAYRV
jgi:stearoyl-CoA desaturase (delta-9 desaturase)